MKLAGSVSLLLVLVFTRPAGAQDPQASLNKWEITDNSFLVEEAFNQEGGVFQNIFSWTKSPRGDWQASFTQEWPAPSMTHQFSFTIPVSGSPDATGFNDLLINYRYQLAVETSNHPAVAPRVSVVVPTGHQNEGLGNGVVGLQLSIPASKHFGNLYFHVNGGATWLADADWIPLVGSSVIWRAAPMWNFMFEVVGEPGRSLTLSPGLRRGWNVRRGQLVIGAAVPITRETDHSATTAFLTYFSYETKFR
jgi:hypothetical protein